MPWTLCLSTKVTSSSVLKSSGEFELTTVREASSWTYFIASCLVWKFSSASSRSRPSTRSLSGESCIFSVFYLIPAIAGQRAIKERLPQRKVFDEQAPTAACPQCAWIARARSSLLAALILPLALCPHHNTEDNEIQRGGIDWPL